MSVLKLSTSLAVSYQTGVLFALVRHKVQYYIRPFIVSILFVNDLPTIVDYAEIYMYMLKILSCIVAYEF